MPENRDFIIRQLARAIDSRQKLSLEIQELFEQLLPVGEQVTVVEKNRAMETEIVKHHSHKKKAAVMVRDIETDRVFDTDLSHMIVPGLPGHLRMIDPPEAPEPEPHFLMRYAHTHGIQVPSKTDLTSIDIELNRHKAIQAEGEQRRIPTHGARPKYPLWALLPGDSFYTESVTPARLRTAVGQANSRTKAQYAVRAEPPGVRVYRLK